MSWDQLRRRNELVEAVLTSVARTKAIPAELRPAVDAEFGGLDAEFGGLGGLLCEVQRRWYTTFDARLDELLESWPDDVPAALTRLEREVDEVMPAAAVLLGTYRAHPALARLHAHHERELRAALNLTEQLPAA